MKRDYLKVFLMIFSSVSQLLRGGDEGKAFRFLILCTQLVLVGPNGMSSTRMPVGGEDALGSGFDGFLLAGGGSNRGAIQKTF